MSRRLTAALTLVVALLAPLVTAAPAGAATKLTHAQAAAQLSNAGVTWSSSGSCSDRNNPTCTSFEQINQSTISGVITLEQASGCAVNVTGGTETGHASGTYSHWNGWKVDISRTGCVDGYVTGAFTYSGVRSDGAPMYTAPSGNVYANEGSHWDVVYYTCGC